MKKFLVDEKEGKRYYKDIEILDHPEKLAAMSNDLAWKILQLINKRPMYPNEISKKLKVHEQKIYYHINKMLKAGLIEVVHEEIKHGAICKYFAPTSYAFGIELPGGEVEFKLNGKAKINTNIKNFFYEFIKNGVFNGSIVVGAPTPHGPYLTAARDGHFAVQLGIFLGRFCSLENRFVIKLDTEVKAEEAYNRNMIVIGGPVTNMIFADLNESLKVKFVWKRAWIIQSAKNEYVGELDGIIAKITNPWDEGKKIILLAGSRAEGTKACILAITQQYEKVLKGFNKNKEFYRIIRGLDRDGDGKVDDIEILE